MTSGRNQRNRSNEQVDQNQQNKRRRQDDSEDLVEAHDKRIALEQWNVKVARGCLWWLPKYYDFYSVKNGTNGGVCMVKCKVEGCSSAPLTYDMGAGTTSGMINHLKRLHGIKVVQKGDKSSTIDDSDAPTLPYSTYSPEYMQVTQGLLFHIIKDKLSLNTTESSGYRFLLQRLNARYRPPSRFWLSSQALPALHKKCQSRLKDKISTISHRVAITSDGWKNIKNTGFSTMTGRYAVLQKDGIVIKEKLLDFKATIGAQVASTVLQQLKQQTSQTGVHMSDNLPCFITTDRGSNIRSAIASTPALRGIPCLSHVLHRAVLEAIDLTDGDSPVRKVIAMSAAFNKSIPRATAFTKWQSEEQKLTPLLPVTVSRTRWHGYLDSIIRHLMIQDRILDWIDYVQLLPNNDHLNVEPLLEFKCYEDELQKLKSLCYVLQHLKLFDSVAQATTQSTAPKYCRIIRKILERLAYISTLDGTSTSQYDALTEKDRRIAKEVVETHDKRNSKYTTMFTGKDNIITGNFAAQLHKSIKSRYTLNQLDEILLVSFFDPHWQLDLPKWALSYRTSQRDGYEIKQATKRAVVDLAKACKPLEDAMKQPVEATTQRTGISPAAENSDTLTRAGVPSSHQSNEGINTPPQQARTLDYQHPAPKSPDDLAPSSADSNCRKSLYQKRKENTLDGEYMGINIKHGQNQWHIGWGDDEQDLAVEMLCYINDRELIESTPRYLDPLAYWFDKRVSFPNLFVAALKVLSVPATSVLSEQIFSGAGNISTKQRSSLSVRTIERLVLLQRSISKQDVEALTGDDFRAERRNLEWNRKERLMQKAIQRARELNQNTTQAAEAAAAAYTEAGDEQMVLAGTESFTIEGHLEEGDTLMEVDDALDEINQVAAVESIAEELSVVSCEYRILTRRQMATMTKQQQKDYMTNGLD